MNVAILGEGYLGETATARTVSAEELAAEAAAKGESPFYQKALLEIIKQGGAGWQAYINAKFDSANTVSEKEDLRKIQRQINAGEIAVPGGGLPGGNTVWIIGGSAALVLMVILATRRKSRRRRR